MKGNIMTPFIRKNSYAGPVQAVVLDWAGTAVDHGCMAPAAVFVEVFKSFDIDVTTQQARMFMGVEKKEHIRKMCALEQVSAAWQAKYGKAPDETDIQILYDKTFSLMNKAIADNAEPIEGVIETMDKLRAMGIKVGSSTGYVSGMMDVLVPLAEEKGYRPDAVFCSSDAPAGRPWPWMCYLNAITLGVYPMEAMVKIGDTVADIEEGLNAGMWTIGVTRTGNELGLPAAQVAELDPETLTQRLSGIEARFRQAGVHYVIESAADVLPVIEEINSCLAKGQLPGPNGGVR